MRGARTIWIVDVPPGPPEEADDVFGGGEGQCDKAGLFGSYSNLGNLPAQKSYFADSEALLRRALKCGRRTRCEGQPRLTLVFRVRLREGPERVFTRPEDRPSQRPTRGFGGTNRPG